MRKVILEGSRHSLSVMGSYWHSLSESHSWMDHAKKAKCFVFSRNSRSSCLAVTDRYNNRFYIKPSKTKIL